jgi:hypothetical protein
MMMTEVLYFEHAILNTIVLLAKRKNNKNDKNATALHIKDRVLLKRKKNDRVWDAELEPVGTNCHQGSEVRCATFEDHDFAQSRGKCGASTRALSS